VQIADEPLDAKDAHPIEPPRSAAPDPMVMEDPIRHVEAELKQQKFEAEAAERQRQYDLKMAEFRKEMEQRQREHDLQEAALFHQAQAEQAMLQIQAVRPPPPSTPKSGILSTFFNRR